MNIGKHVHLTAHRGHVVLSFGASGRIARVALECPDARTLAAALEYIAADPDNAEACSCPECLEAQTWAAGALRSLDNTPSH